MRVTDSRERPGRWQTTALATTAASLVCLGATAPAQGAVPHVVQPGETLWGIATANGLTAPTVAAWNGLPAEYFVIAGETIQVPSLEETGGAAVAAEPAAVAPAYGLATISGPMGSVQLDQAAATAFESMRAASLAQFGIDLFPDGSLSGYRTYEQQAYLYDLFLSGQGAPANPPGTSAHEIGTALDLSDPAMRSVVDQIGPSYGWYGISSEWWHIEYSG